MKIIELHDGRFILDKNKEVYLITATNVVCRRFMHECTHYPRDGYRNEDLTRYTIPIGTKLKALTVHTNFIDGDLVTVMYNGIVMEVLPRDLRYKP